MAWVNETALPFTPTGRIFFSPIINDLVYVIDQDTEFWQYNIVSGVWTQLTSPSYGGSGTIHFNRTLAISPDGTTLACISEYEYYFAGPTASRRIGGGRRIEFYTISTGLWTASKQTDFVIGGGGVSYVRAIVWEDDDTIWAWCTEAYATDTQVNLKIFRGKCVKYVISTDTWTQYTNYFMILGHHATIGPTWYGRASCAAIKADGSVVYLGATGGAAETANYWTYGKYTVATDTYAARIALATLSDEFIYAYDKDKLWYYEAGGTCQQGYVDTADDSENEDQFTENTDRDAGYGLYCGITDDLVKIIAHARAAAPELMSETIIVAPTVTTDPATGRGAIAATINGTLNQDGGEACECGFEWGLDTSYGITTPTQSKTKTESFSQVISGLEPNTVYHFRAFATNSVGTSHGADRTFTTSLIISKAHALAREEL